MQVICIGDGTSRRYAVQADCWLECPIDSAGAFVNYVAVGFVWKTVMEVILLPITYPTIAAVRRAEHRYVSDPA